MRFPLTLCALGLSGALLAQDKPGSTPAKSLTLEQVAQKIGYEMADLRVLTTKKKMSPQDILDMTDTNRRLLLDRLKAQTGAKRAIEQRLMVMQDEFGNIPADAEMKAQAQASTMDLVDGIVGGLDSDSWSELGPGNIGGRVRALVVHPTITTRLFCGGVAGGIWRSLNSGATWSSVQDSMDNLAVTVIRFDPSNSNTMYAGTGEGFGNGDSIRGAGIFKSTNGGSSWTRLASTNNSSFHYVNEISIANGVILAATRSGIWRSTDGGDTWTRTFTADARDVSFHPNNNNRAVAHVRTTACGIYTTNAGLTWSNSSGLTTGGIRRIEFAWHKGYTGVNAGYVYALKDSSSTLYRSANAGQSFVLVSTNTMLGTQGWYDNAIQVMEYPRDTNFLNDVIVAGGIDLWRSTNGGGSFTKISRWSSWPNSAHADQHVIVPHPNYNGSSNRQVFFGNDGGVWQVNDILTVSETTGWNNRNTSLGITQFYGASRNDSSGILVGGTQDNGTLRDTDSTGYNSWTRPSGGDGGFTASDPTNSNYHYMEYQNGVFRRSTNGGTSATTLRSFSGSLFIAPFILDPNNANRLLYGASSLWRSNNIKSGTPTWATIHTNSGSVSAIAVAPGNSNIMWVGYSNGDVFSSTNATATTPTWTRRDSAGLPNRFPTRITIDPSNSSRVYVCFGGFSTSNIYRTTNGGTSWSALTGLPSAPVRDLEINPKVSTVLYAATQVGLMISEDNGSSWSSSATPNRATIDEMFWGDGDTLYLVTHARGIWRQKVGTPSGALTSLYYRFDEGNGSTTTNLGTNATRTSTVVHTGTPSNGPWTWPGQYGNAMLQGSSNTSAAHNNYVDTGWNGPLAGDFTISFFARQRVAPGTALSYVFGGLSTFRCFTGGVANTGLLVRSYGGTDLSFPGNFQALTAGRGACIALTVDNTAKSAQWYVNGVANGAPIAFTGDVNVPVQSSSFRIGMHTSTTSSCAYDLDEFRLEHRVVPVAELDAWCDGQSSLHYKFDRAMGTTAVNYGAGPRLNSEMVSGGGSPWVSPGKWGSGMVRGSDNTSSTDYHYCDTGWTGPIQGSFSLFFWAKERVDPGATLSYLFGGVGSFRCFTNGVADENLLLRTWGGADLRFPGDFKALARASGGVCIGLTVDAAAREAQWFANGSPVGDPVPIANGANVPVSTSTFKIGKHSSNASSSAYDIDEFRFENFVASSSEMSSWCISPVAAVGRYGNTCGLEVGTLGGAPVIGNADYAHTIRFQSGLNAPVLFVIGVKTVPSFDMGIAFPRLSGCDWWTSFDVQFVLPVPGSTVVPGGVPNQSSLNGLHLDTQALSATGSGFFQSNAVSHVIQNK